MDGYSPKYGSFIGSDPHIWVLVLLVVKPLQHLGCFGVSSQSEKLPFGKRLQFAMENHHFNAFNVYPPVN
jgi:hypothetical protein